MILMDILWDPKLEESTTIDLFRLTESGDEIYVESGAWTADKILCYAENSVHSFSYNADQDRLKCVVLNDN